MNISKGKEHTFASACTCTNSDLHTPWIQVGITKFITNRENKDCTRNFKIIEYSFIYLNKRSCVCRDLSKHIDTHIVQEYACLYVSIGKTISNAHAIISSICQKVDAVARISQSYNKFQKILVMVDKQQLEKNIL